MTRKTRLCLAVTLALAAGAAQSQDWRAKTDVSVTTRVDRGEAVDVLIELRTHAQLQMLAPAPHASRVAASARQLQGVAATSQAPLRALLDSRGIRYRPFWIANAIAARVPATDLPEIAARADVAHIESDAPRRTLILPPQETEAQSVRSPDAVEWGVARVNAPQVWAQGYTGQGVVVAGQDTGYHWTHAGLQSKYRGWNGMIADHNYNWHDAIHALIGDSTPNSCGLDVVAPCDDGSHGTHTMGTMVGSEGANEVGVAPGAKWIGCRNMEEGDGRPSTYIECFQWFALPTDLAGANPDATKAPHVINNSWGCPIGPPPGGEDCVVDSIQQAVDNVRNGAGILVVVSAGNSGASCSTVSAPPSYYASAFTVGSTTIAVPDAISGFSSRGPATADGSNRLKPDISAPGSSIRSTTPTGYASFSGTSMAGPHVAGVAALLMSADPSLRGDPDAVEAILTATARPFTSTQDCPGFPGASVPNAVFGYGIIDAAAAVASVTMLMRDGFEDP